MTNPRTRAIRDGINPEPWQHTVETLETAGVEWDRAMDHLSKLDLELMTGHVAALVRLSTMALDHAVSMRRSRGDSWSAIAEDLGVSKQAAQQRFTPKPADHRRAADSLAMF